MIDALSTLIHNINIANALQYRYLTLPSSRNIVASTMGAHQYEIMPVKTIRTVISFFQILTDSLNKTDLD